MATKSATKASSRTSTVRKATTDRKAPVKSAAKTLPKSAAKPTSKPAATPAKPPRVSVVKEAQATSTGTELKKRELIDLVVERSDVKKKFAKPVVEAMLEVLGEAIAQERSLNLQPMGRVVPQRTKDAGKNRVVITRIRQSKERAAEAAAAHAANQAVAKAAE